MSFLFSIKYSVLLLMLIEFSQETLLSIEPKDPLPGKRWPPGSPWPLPYSWRTTDDLVTFDVENFKIVKGFKGECDPIEFAINKYNQTFLFPVLKGDTFATDPRLHVVRELVVKITGNATENDCTEYPKLSDNPETYEAYYLEIAKSKGNEKTATSNVVAKTVWGALRGIETFSQLIFSNENNQTVSSIYFYANQTIIRDMPRFSHRGLMIDSARHYLPERIFYQILDGMMYNKLNVLHWHIVDDQSFPYVSRRFPELSQKGAYNDKAVYTPGAVGRIIQAARLRGIRVIFEFDTPGHTQGFGKAHPELLTPCYGKGPGGDPEAPNFPEHAGRENLNPTQDFTYEFMRQFFEELRHNVTKDSFVHVGMDEVYMACWDRSHNPVIAQFMDDYDYTSHHQVQEHYTMKHIEMIKSLSLNPISWQDPLDADVDLDTSVVVQLWKDWGGPWTGQLRRVLEKGHRVILSSPWYINHITYGESWRKYYRADPIKSVYSLNKEQRRLVLGGEACIWGEFVDRTNIIPRIFPFASAIAERLWTFNISIDLNAEIDARARLDQHRCRMLRRGLAAQPILNGYCGRWESLINNPY